MAITERRVEELLDGFCAKDEHLRYLMEKSELKPVIIALLERLARCEKAAPTTLCHPYQAGSAQDRNVNRWEMVISQ